MIEEPLVHCFNKKVLIGLAVAAGVVLLAAPRTFWSAVPLLAVLACPLSMLLMMRRSRGGIQGEQSNSCATPGRVAEQYEELRRLREEVAILKARRHLGQADPVDRL
ncbi:DUF2933 domain-containing protein [Candidatus Protofrankia californiensis]|uniref:DUF2933 domain-containing protein n=1 Tax=Candidatus Protofrankia californiensis TaxID=1839754 RepID=UPI0010410255|nr:DUF2933 domain-containing protein [Candidatus Protofrankia californiensis]